MPIILRVIYLQVLSYGGFLRYSLIFVLPNNDSIVTEALMGADVILVGNKGERLEYYSMQQPYDSASTDMKTQLYEV